MKDLDPKKLSDNELSLEINHAQRRLDRALQKQRQASNRTTDEGLIYLDSEVYKREEYLRAQPKIELSDFSSL